MYILLIPTACSTYSAHAQQAVQVFHSKQEHNQVLVLLYHLVRPRCEQWVDDYGWFIMNMKSWTTTPPAWLTIMHAYVCFGACMMNAILADKPMFCSEKLTFVVPANRYPLSPEYKYDANNAQPPWHTAVLCWQKDFAHWGNWFCWESRVGENLAIAPWCGCGVCIYPTFQREVAPKTFDGGYNGVADIRKTP